MNICKGICIGLFIGWTGVSLGQAPVRVVAPGTRASGVVSVTAIRDNRRVPWTCTTRNLLFGFQMEKKDMPTFLRYESQRAEPIGGNTKEVARLNRNWRTLSISWTTAPSVFPSPTTKFS